MKIALVVLMLSVCGSAYSMKDSINKRSPLFDAIDKGQAEQVKESAKNRDLLEEKDDIGRTPLQYAVCVYPEKLAIVSALLECGANVNSKDLNGYTVLHFVELEDLARLLLDHGAQLLSDGFGNTPVHSAAWAGHTGIVRVLLTHVTPADIPADSHKAQKKEVIENIIKRKLEAARHWLATGNMFSENPHAYAGSRGAISFGGESELSRLIDGAHIEGLRECIRQSASKVLSKRN
ncbi:MAG: ankyrin repeat domain-containing protein [Candidatus Babeliales bacterium]